MPVVVTTEPAGAGGHPSVAAATIAIELAGKYCVRVGGGFDAPTLRRVLDVLEGR
jgi:hypothetical protein